MKYTKIIATDLDRTLLPNGKEPKDILSIPLFNNLIVDNKNILLVYVTGRSLKLTKNAIKKYKLMYPDILISDVGSIIRSCEDGKFKTIQSWEKLVYEKCPKWNVEEIKIKLLKIKGLIEQKKETLNKFKQSYNLDSTQKDQILQKVNAVIKDKFDEEIVYSYDPLTNTGLLDILPKHATKQSALLYVINKYKLTLNDTLYCGDSGNDILPLTSGVNALIVKNGKNEVKNQVKKKLTKENQKRKLYIAKGDFKVLNRKLKKLNGNYASGIIEGAYHFGFFK